MGNLQELYSELIQTDASLIGDAFRPIYEKGLELHLIDAEEQIESMEERLSEARSMFYSKRSSLQTCNLHVDEFNNWVKEQQKLSEDLLTLCKDIDQSFVNDEDDSIDCPSEGLALYNYLEMYIDRLSLSDLAVTMDVIEQMHYMGNISWFYYIECGLAVSYRLTKATWNNPKAGWSELLDKFRAWKQTHHAKTVSYEDKFFADMNLDMESALDFMNKVRDMAAKNHMSDKQMFYILLEEYESQADGLPAEGYNQDLDNWEVEAMLADFTLNYRD